MRAESAFYALLDVLVDAGPSAFRKAGRRIMGKHLRVHVSTHNSSKRFFLIRAWQTWKVVDVPLFKRAYHVPDESGVVTLEELKEPILNARYVIQYHEAERAGTHFDVRIEYKDRAISWAVPMKGKRAGWKRMPEPGEKWLAIRQPDHTIDYMSFEGEIPEGLGKGDVSIYASGVCDILKIEDGHVHVRFLDGAAQGNYVLVDTGKGGLLVPKMEAEPEAWDKPRYTKRDLDYVERKCGTDSCVAETKVDGGSIEIQVDKHGQRVVSHRISRRSATRIEHTDRLPHLRDARRADGLEGTRLRGEAWHPKGVSFLAGTLNSGVRNARQRQREHGPVQVRVFDITHYRGRDVRELPYRERRALYEQACRDIHSSDVRPARQVSSGFAHFYVQEVVRKDLPTDGIVVKNQEAAYGQEPWIKVKPSDLADCIVVGVNEGLGKHHRRLGALVVRAPDGSHIHVGAGFSDRERAWIWAHRRDVKGEVARVEFHVRAGERSNTGPRFDSWHPDQSEEVNRMYADIE